MSERASEREPPAALQRHQGRLPDSRLPIVELKLIKSCIEK